MSALQDSITDVAGIKVGHWTDLEAGTGCTVVLCEQGAVPGVDVRGGAPGTRDTDITRPGYTARRIDGVVLAGGSTFGLAAVDGVMRWCEENGLGLPFGGHKVPVIAGAVIFDFNLIRSDVRPDAASGYAAALAASTGPPAEGTVGAGTGATVAGLLGREKRIKGGIGSASEDIGDGIIVAAIVAVNAAGAIYNGDGTILAGPRAVRGHFLDPLPGLKRLIEAPAEGNTTIAVVATNAVLSKEQANRIASIAHDGYARAIRPVHTLVDGDTIFCLATCERDLPTRAMIALETFAPIAVERAIRKAVLAATSLGGVPSLSEWRSLA